MPKEAEILQAMYQPTRDASSVWALIDCEEKETTKRCFEIVGTGDALLHYSEYAKHCGSFVEPDGFHVFHVFEVECIATEKEK